jgi:hypothetical protein
MQVLNFVIQSVVMNLSPEMVIDLFTTLGSCSCNERYLVGTMTDTVSLNSALTSKST